MMKYKWMGVILLLLPFLLSSCNNSDDVLSIFTGRVWRMTYITKRNEHGWYKFPGVDDSIYKSYEPMNGTRSFVIDFTGSEDDNVVNGDFVGSNSVKITGTWTANGVSNFFSSSIRNSSVTDSKDTLGKYIIDGIKNASSYSGDENNLYLYFEYGSEMLCIAFAPER